MTYNDASNAKIGTTGGNDVFYETAKNNHGLPFNPFKSCVVPRPIGWVSTREP